MGENFVPEVHDIGKLVDNGVIVLEIAQRLAGDESSPGFSRPPSLGTDTRFWYEA